MRKNGEGTCNRIDENTWVCDIFGNLVVEYMNTVYKGTVLDSTYHSYYKSVMNYLMNDKIAYTPVSDLSTKQFVDFYYRILKKFSRNTLSSPKSMCTRCCDWLMEREVIEYNYAREAEGCIDPDWNNDHKQKVNDNEKNRKKTFSDEDILRIYNGFEHNVSEYAAIAFFLLKPTLNL